MAKGPWSDFETIVLHQILKDNSSSDTHKVYNDIVDYSKALYCVQPLPSNVVFRTKTETEISSKISFEKSKN